MHSRYHTLGRMLALMAMLALVFSFGGNAKADASSRYFGETGHTVTQPFLTYWNTHGALAQQGYPITDDYQEVNADDGNTYRTQYFERARFEYHPEQTDPTYQVLLGLLGVESFHAKYPAGLPSGTAEQIVPGGGSFHFNETGYNVTGLFLSYWQTHGALAQQGYPITPAYLETNDADGNIYVTQYFQRARFEYHPEQNDPQYKVLLGLVGNEVYHRRHSGSITPTPTHPPRAPPATPTPNPVFITQPPQGSPADGTLFHNYPRSATFTWNPITWGGGAVTYNIDIDYYDTDWHNFHTQTGIAGTSYYMPAFIGDNQGRWRVWATTPQGDSARSGWWTFSFSTAAPTATPTNTPLPTSHTVTQVVQQVSVGAHTYGSIVANCPSGAYVTGGGWASNTSLDVYNSSMSGNGWQVYATNTTGSPQLLNSYAVCMSGLTTAPTEVSTQISIAAGAHNGGSKACAAGQHLTGGGFAKNTGELIYNESPSGNGWSAYAYNTTAGSLLLNIYAVCYAGTMDSNVQSTQISVPNGGIGHGTASCASDHLATGGGFAMNDGMLAYTTDRNGNGWEVYANNSSGSSTLLNTYAVCVNVPLRSNHHHLPPSSHGQPLKGCPFSYAVCNLVSSYSFYLIGNRINRLPISTLNPT